MKRILFFILISTQLIAQDLKLYKPDGTLLSSGKTINSVMKEFFPTELAYSHSTLSTHYNEEKKQGVMSVYFKIFTNTPLFVVATNPKPKQIKEAIDSFDINEFYHNWKFEFEIRRNVKSGALQDHHLYTAFGKPSVKNTTSDGATTLTTISYDSPLPMIFEIENGFVRKFSILQ